MSLAAMEQEAENQVENLPKFASSLLALKPLRMPPSELVFTGSGDSYAAALFAQELSGGVALASDPYELSQKTHLANGKNVFVISVSGRTAANLELARRVKRVARKRIAVTANPNSPLGKQCDKRIILRYQSAGRLTSGTLSFTASLLVCAYILGKLPVNLNLRTAMKKASEWARSLKIPLKGGFLFVGSGVNRALAEYGACKIHEVLGAKASAQFPEQVGHAQLFSIDRRKDTIVCISMGANDKTRELARLLQRNGFRVHTITGHSKNIVARTIEVSFYLQHLALTLAKRRGMEECSFLADQPRLQLSSRLIYPQEQALGYFREVK